MKKADALTDTDDTRTDIESFPAHGGDLARAERLSGHPANEIIDFSVNLNPLGPPPAIAQSAGDLLQQLRQYPDPDCGELKRVLSDQLEVDPSCITVTNGSTEFIYLLPRLWRPGGSVALVTPCFSEYARAFESFGIATQTLSARQGEGFEIPMARIAELLNRDAALQGLVLTRPNNPTGDLWPRETVLDLLRLCESRKIFFVVDESYIEFCDPGESLSRWVSNYRYLVVIRSLTKFYSLPGIRLGYGLLHPDAVREIDCVKPPWSVNTLAQVWGTLALNDSDFAERSRASNRRLRDNLFHRLSEIPTLRPYPSGANFILFQLQTQDERVCRDLYRFLLERKILIRNCGNFDGLTPSHFRVAVLGERENELLIRTLLEFFDTENP